MKYSKVYSYKYGEHTNKFRYNYDECRLEYVYKPSATDIEEMKDDAECCKLDWLRAEAIANLRSVEETGYAVIDSCGLSANSWKEDKDYYMDVFSEDIACTCGF